MFDDKNAVVLVVLLLVVIQPEVEPQPTIDSFEDESCSQSDEERRILTAENDLLKLELESEKLIKKLQPQKVVVKLSERLISCHVVYGVTIVVNKIYVLCHSPNLIKVFENRNQFRYLTDIALNVTKLPCDIVYSKESECFYIGDASEDCIWKMTTTNDHQLTKWLTNAAVPRIVSLSAVGQVLKLKVGEPFSQLIFYGSKANVVRSLQLPLDIKRPRHAVQTLTGDFILSHRLDDASNGTWVISKLNNAGQLIHRFIPRNQAEELDHPVHLSLDSDNSRLFVADYFNHRVVLLDSNTLTFSQILLSNEANEIYFPSSLFYDVIQNRLMVAHHSANGTQGKVDRPIYELN